MIRSFGNLALIVAITICLQACSNSFVPPMPPDIDPDIYSDATQLKPDIEADQFAYSIVGLRLAEKGFYIDMLIEGPVDSLEVTASMVGSSMLYPRDFQEKEIQLRDPEGQNVPLLSVFFPPRQFQMPFDNTPYDPALRIVPPTYLITKDSNSGKAIQVLMRRTRRQYKPGLYKIRLTESWQDRHDPDEPPSLVDTEWRNIFVNWTKSDQKH